MANEITYPSPKRKIQRIVIDLDKWNNSSWSAEKVENVEEHDEKVAQATRQEVLDWMTEQEKKHDMLLTYNYEWEVLKVRLEEKQKVKKCL